MPAQIAAAAGALRLRRGLPESLPPARPRAGARAARRGRLPERHRSRRPASRCSSRFDIGNTSAEALLRYEFMCDAWRQLGLDVEIAATTYNQFQDKVRRGAYQIFKWGWVADFPDPENFLFLLSARTRARRAAGRTPPTSATPSSTGSSRDEGPAQRRPSAGAHRAACARSSSASGRGSSSSTPRPTRLATAGSSTSKPLGISFPTCKYQDVDPAAARAQRRRSGTSRCAGRSIWCCWRLPAPWCRPCAPTIGSAS